MEILICIIPFIISHLLEIYFIIECITGQIAYLLKGPPIDCQGGGGGEAGVFL